MKDLSGHEKGLGAKAPSPIPFGNSNNSTSNFEKQYTFSTPLLELL